MKRILVLAAVSWLTLSRCSNLLEPEHSLEGTFTNGSIRLSYVLDYPDRKGPFPVVVLGHGSGPRSKESLKSFGNGFLERGVAVFRYDKRGVAGSSGQYVDIGVGNSVSEFPKLASDMSAAVDFVKTLPDVDSTRIGLAGVSQSGWIIPLVAQMNSSVRFAMIRNGNAVCVGLQVTYQNLSPLLSVQERREALKRFDGNKGFDPEPVLRSISVPILWLFGGEDQLTPADENVSLLSRIGKESNKKYHIISYPEGIHTLQSINYWVDVDKWLSEVL